MSKFCPPNRKRKSLSNRYPPRQRPSPPNRRPPPKKRRSKTPPILIWGPSVIIVIAIGWLVFRALLPSTVSEAVVADIQPTPLTTQVNVAMTGEDELDVSPVASPPPTNVVVSQSTAAPTSFATKSGLTLPDVPVLQQQMLALVNGARVANGLFPVAWDETAVSAATLHAQDMAQHNYFSHWNQEGLGPEHRYMLIGGEHVVMENLHSFFYTYEDGRAAPITNWQEVIQNAHDGLMNSPGHYANIMDPAHTHVGIGMAYNAETGQFRLAQEFTNQYVQLVQPIPVEVELGDVVVVNGRITSNNISNILLNLSYEPFPDSMTIKELDATSTYSSVAESVKTIAISAEFDERIVIDKGGGTGFYHIRIFGDLPTGQALLMDRIIMVR